MNRSSMTIGKIARLAVLVAIITLMSFTFIGFLPVGPLSLTLLPIPVAIGAMMYGPLEGACLGALFGIFSFVRAAKGLDLGPVLLSISLPLTIIVCVVPRILEGWLTGLIFKALYKIDKTRVASYIIGGFSTAALNTIFFMGGLFLLFWNSFVVGYAESMGVSGGVWAVVSFIMGTVLVQAIIEAALCAAVSGTVSKIMMRYFPDKNPVKEF